MKCKCINRILSYTRDWLTCKKLSRVYVYMKLKEPQTCAPGAICAHFSFTGLGAVVGTALIACFFKEILRLVCLCSICKSRKNMVHHSYQKSFLSQFSRIVYPWPLHLSFYLTVSIWPYALYYTSDKVCDTTFYTLFHFIMINVTVHIVKIIFIHVIKK